MYGDTDVIRKQVVRLREQGGDIRSMADQLVSQVEGIAWSGRAADTMRERMRERAGRLREVAARHESAADSLDKHVDEVELAKETIAAVERKAEGLVSDARARIAAVERAASLDGDVHRTPDPVDEQLAGFVAPERGHRDWLGVDLPGL
jgi:hypothetical protein